MAEYAELVFEWMIIIPLLVVVVHFWCRSVMWCIRIAKIASAEIARHAEA